MDKSVDKSAESRVKQVALWAGAVVVLNQAVTVVIDWTTALYAVFW